VTERRIDAQGVRRNRTLKGDVNLLGELARGLRGSLELRWDGGEFVAMIVPMRGVAVSARGKTAVEAFQALELHLEERAGRQEPRPPRGHDGAPVR
jgi:predicted RNase H-like HicB family nuclease